MERRAVVVSVQTLRAELLWVVAGVGHEDQGLWAWVPRGLPCPTPQINLCDTLQHFVDSLTARAVHQGTLIKVLEISPIGPQVLGYVRPPRSCHLHPPLPRLPLLRGLSGQAVRNR